MKKRCLIVLCGLKIGGVETYVCRLSKALANNNIEPTVLILSRKSDQSIVSNLEGYANLVWIDEVQKIRGYTSWLNAFIPLKDNFRADLNEFFDYVHVVDSLSLHFFVLNRNKFNFGKVTIGAYHEQEFFWWRNDNVLFREEQISIAKLNATSILFPNEIMRDHFALANNMTAESLPLLPLGVDMPEYQIMANKRTLKIVSIGRLVDFKTYNEGVISVLPALRMIADFRYEIYGSGPLEKKLKTMVSDLKLDGIVTFKGNVAPESLGNVLNEAFCFVGSGTTIITSASYGVPSIVGIESNLDTTCGGLFCDVPGYSYNESSCHDHKISIYDSIVDLHKKSDVEYQHVCELHIKKANEFNIKNTINVFLNYFTSSIKVPAKLHTRLRCAFSAICSLIPIVGPGIFSFKSRYYKK
ncbi:glycosyltransferase family 4 protein [Paraherbaspirillum soli]|uniref:Glycosyltransferase family 4 protein n=1 Tax=Paraherbaspirillum soli TaxID=631222 RepID=A0ABW0MH21_9BURK